MCFKFEKFTNNWNKKYISLIILFNLKNNFNFKTNSSSSFPKIVTKTDLFSSLLLLQNVQLEINSILAFSILPNIYKLSSRHRNQFLIQSINIFIIVLCVHFHYPTVNLHTHGNWATDRTEHMARCPRGSSSWCIERAVCDRLRANTTAFTTRFVRAAIVRMHLRLSSVSRLIELHRAWYVHVRTEYIIECIDERISDGQSDDKCSRIRI